MADDQKICSIGGDKCPVKYFVISVAIVFAVIFLFEMFFHGNIMMEYYEKTARLWRKPEHMIVEVGMIRILVVSVLVSGLYCCNSKSWDCGGSSMKAGIRFGLVIGLLIGIWDFGAYSYMRLPIDIPLMWLVGDVMMFTLVGIVLSLLKSQCKKQDA